MHPTRPRRGRLLALGLLILGPLTLGLLALPALVAVPAAPAHAQGEVETHMGFFPWPVHREVLDNGLHVLVIPTYHTPDLAGVTEDAGGRMFALGRRVAASLRASGLPCEGVNFFLADGAAAGQTVFHSHLHVIPRVRSDGLGFRFRHGLGRGRMSRSQLDEIAVRLASEL